MHDTNDVKNENWRNPETSFDSWKNLWETESSFSVHALAVEFVLLGYWNMDRTGRCNPSLESITKRSRIKSRNTVKKALIELEDSGRWVIDRKSGGTNTNSYYPQFVSKPKMTGKRDLDAEMELRRVTHETVIARTTTNEALTPVTVQGKTAERAIEIEVKQPELVSSVSPISIDDDPKVLTARDLEIKAEYLEQKEYDFYKVAKKSKTRIVKHVLNPGDVRTLGLDNENYHQYYVPGISISYVVGYMGGDWVANYGAKYSKKYNYSFIADIYDALAEPHLDTPMINDELTRIHVALSVLGQNGQGFDLSRVTALMNTAQSKIGNDDFLIMRQQYEETLLGIKHSLRLEQKYGYDDQLVS